MRTLRDGHDRGISLIELAVAMGLSVILGTMATMFFVVANRSNSKTILTNTNTGDARTTLDSWTAMVRVAGWMDYAHQDNQVDRFEEITPKKLVFYANLNNRQTVNSQTAPLTKVALMLVTPSGQSQGHLVEVLFGPDNRTPQRVRQIAVLAGPTNGAWIFTPKDVSGADVDLTVNGCLDSGTPTQGLCTKAPTIPDPGMLDPTVDYGTLTVHDGTLTGDGSVDDVLRNVGTIDIAFTVTDPSSTATMDFASSASVNSGFPS